MRLEPLGELIWSPHHRQPDTRLKVRLCTFLLILDRPDHIRLGDALRRLRLLPACSQHDGLPSSAALENDILERIDDEELVALDGRGLRKASLSLMGNRIVDSVAAGAEPFAVPRELAAFMTRIARTAPDRFDLATFDMMLLPVLRLLDCTRLRLYAGLASSDQAPCPTEQVCRVFLHYVPVVAPDAAEERERLLTALCAELSGAARCTPASGRFTSGLPLA